LRAFREHESPSAAVRDEGFAALRARLDAAAPAPAANARVYAFGRAALVTVAVAAGVLLAIKAVSLGVTALVDGARRPAIEAPYQEEAGSKGGQAVAREQAVVPSRRHGGARVVREPAVPEATAVEPATPEATMVEPAVGEEPQSDRPASSTAPSRTPRSRSPVPSPGSADELQAELALVKRANEAKAERRWADGLAALREHGERFPRGTLAHERMVLEAELHCAAGRVARAEGLVAAFLREHPGSSLTGRMRNVCRDR
jgi:hypothetical protein